MTTRPDDYSPPLSAGPSGYRSPEGGYPGNTQFSSFFIDDILGQEGRVGKRPFGPPPTRPSRPLPVYPSATPSPIPSPPSSPVDPTGGWPSSCLPSAVTPDALALDGGGVLADFRLLPPPFALFHQNVMASGPSYPYRDCRHGHHHHQHQHQHHHAHHNHHQHRLREPEGGALAHFQSSGGTKSFLDSFNDPTAKGNFERWAPLHCHLMALRQSRGLPQGTPGSSTVLGLCNSKRKGGQVRFSLDQTTALERRFGGHKYLSPEERRILAQDLKLTDRQVKTWFQNRRAKWRRSSQTSSSSASLGAQDGRRATSLSEGGGRAATSSSRNSTASSGKGHESKGGDSDVEDEVFQEEHVGAAG